MARTIETILSEQLGGLTLALAKRDAQIEQLAEENTKLREALAALEPKKEVEK